MCVSSTIHVPLFSAGKIIYVSSANLIKNIALHGAWVSNLLLSLHMPLVQARILESHWLEYQHTLILLLNILCSVNVHQRRPVEDLIQHLRLQRYSFMYTEYSCAAHTPCAWHPEELDLHDIQSCHYWKAHVRRQRMVGLYHRRRPPTA